MHGPRITVVIIAPVFVSILLFCLYSFLLKDEMVYAGREIHLDDDFKGAYQHWWLIG